VSAPLEPWPLARADCAAPLAALARGEPWKPVFERLLLALDEERADLLVQLVRESRGAWLPLAHARRGRALVLGNALSGTSVPLARSGFRVVVGDRGRERLALAAARNAALAPGPTACVQAGADARLPFADASFDLVVQEDGAPHAGRDGYALAELLRVCKGELFVSAENRFAYKRSRGRRGQFVVTSPLAYARAALAPRDGECSLAGYKKLLRAPGFAEPRAFALYPHAREFAHVVALDGPFPALTIERHEKKNRLKLLGHRLGLFPLLAPSFGLFAARSQAALRPLRIECVLDELAQRTGEPRPIVEQLLATRGNSVVVQTAVPGAEAEDERGRWTLHVPLSPQQADMLERHHARIDWIAARMPGVPVPAGLFLGEIEGLFLGCERRLGGITAPHLSGDVAAERNMLSDAAEQLAAWILQPSRALTGEDFERLVGARFDLVAEKCGLDSTAAALARMREEAADLLIGKSLPRVLYHGDLRSKHVQVHPDGHVLGYLDWGTSELDDLPYADLLHLLAHARKQADDLRAAEAWALVRDGEGLADHERAALERYAERTGLEPLVCRALERIYPVLVAAVAERNWDFSRPRWVHRQFDL
jgi:aminoglycoside phosphotransferase (APT) family kinase protein